MAPRGIPTRPPNCNAYAERFVRSITEECLDRLIVLGERHLRCAIAEIVRGHLNDPGAEERVDACRGQ